MLHTPPIPPFSREGQLLDSLPRSQRDCVVSTYIRLRPRFKAGIAKLRHGGLFCGNHSRDNEELIERTLISLLVRQACAQPLPIGLFWQGRFQWDWGQLTPYLGQRDAEDYAWWATEQIARRRGLKTHSFLPPSEPPNITGKEALDRFQQERRNQIERRQKEADRQKFREIVDLEADKDLG